jgi:phosphonate transport system permease protein
MASASMLPIRQERPFLEWKKGIADQRGRQAVSACVLAGLVVFAAWRSGVSIGAFATGMIKGLSLVGMFFPPDWSALASMLPAITVTAMIAMASTILGMCLSLPCALVASSNLAPAPLRLVMRAIIATERGLPEIVQMLLLIPIFGLGVIPGLVALCFSSVGMLARLLADAIEEIEPQMLEAVAGTGATRLQVVRYAVIPQILPSLLAHGLFRFEFNVREGVLLGAVGAGGIGYVMRSSMESADYRTASMATLLTLALVFGTERVSDFLRARILREGALR